MQYLAFPHDVLAEPGKYADARGGCDVLDCVCGSTMSLGMRVALFTTLIAGGVKCIGDGPPVLTPVLTGWSSPRCRYLESKNGSLPINKIIQNRLIKLKNKYRNIM